MKNKDNTFSLFDFCKKRADKIQIYGDESLDDEGNVIPFIEQAAYVTHYLQLKNKAISLPYRDKAESLLNLWYEFVSNKKKTNDTDFVNIAAESQVAMQEYLFPDLFQAPFQAPQNARFSALDDYGTDSAKCHVKQLATGLPLEPHVCDYDLNMTKTYM